MRDELDSVVIPIFQMQKRMRKEVTMTVRDAVMLEVSPEPSTSRGVTTVALLPAHLRPWPDSTSPLKALFLQVKQDHSFFPCISPS